MRSLVYFVATSADGYIAEPDGRFDRFPVQGDHIDALIAEFPEMLPGSARTALRIDGAGRFDTVLEGRATHQVGLDAGIADAYPHLRHLVFSSTLDAVDPAVELVRDDPLALVRDLKRADGADIWLCGGGRLAATLLPEIDEIVLKVNPVLFGEGIPLLGGTRPVDLELIGVRPFEPGVVWQSYRIRR
ncbi:dihydrofolate reductase family protein [Naasia lichenicola]|uniref:Dihydrofolate reductase n=1 Tax=Naasia lichenicola TaxID=2565933 RepID=A0A4S4FLC4_9MICO|nr:dihydrofolate reductase family protein [Naasia lichenicola]THG30998.1 dihydrofolate reductase [Naasia lichenicola]